jgi:hypothetical protein
VAQHLLPVQIIQQDLACVDSAANVFWERGAECSTGVWELNESKSIGFLRAHIGDIAMTMVMTVVPLLGAAIGLSVGLARFKVFALLPAILIVAACAIGGGLAAGLELRFIALAVLVGVVSPQIAYLAGFLAASSPVAKHLRVRYTSWF